MPEDTKDIFISYRRDESAGYAGRIADGFTEHFGEDRVFRDIDSIEPGLDFAEAIERAVGSSEVLLAVIGRNWSTATDAAGHKRLENPDDYVRLEIAAALQRDIRVIPVLVQGATMPSTDELPDDLAPLARRNAFELHDSSWREELQRLLTTLDRVLERRPGGKRDTSSQRVEGLRARVRHLVYRRGPVRWIIALIVLVILVYFVGLLVDMAVHPEVYFN
jgi:TIR domain